MARSLWKRVDDFVGFAPQVTYPSTFLPFFIVLAFADREFGLIPVKFFCRWLFLIPLLVGGGMAILLLSFQRHEQVCVL